MCKNQGLFRLKILQQKWKLNESIPQQLKYLQIETSQGMKIKAETRAV